MSEVTHLHTYLDCPRLTQYLDIVKGETESTLQVHLYSGDLGSKRQVIEILELLHARDDIDLVSCSLINSFSSEDLAIDSRTGEVFAQFNPKHDLVGIPANVNTDSR